MVPPGGLCSPNSKARWRRRPPVHMNGEREDLETALRAHEEQPKRNGLGQVMLRKVLRLSSHLPSEE